MNYSKYFSILFCTISMLMISACEKSEIHRAMPADAQVIVPRATCEDCPVNDCCCSVEWVSGDMILEICGSTASILSTTPCGPIVIPGMAGCPDVLLTYYQGPFSINSASRQEIFCVPENASFMLGASTGGGVVRITCQHGQTSPQTVTPTISAPNKYYYTTNDDCELSGC